MMSLRCIPFLLAAIVLPGAEARGLPIAESARPPSPGEYPELLTGGPPLEFAAAKQNTLVVFGGPGTTAGKFEDANGNPTLFPWTSVDLTDQPQRWHIGDYNCQNLDPATVPNHAWWCGRDYDFDCGSGDFGGYGADWLQTLEWTGTAPDPGLPVQVTIQARLNHDLEAGYDFLYLGYRSQGVLEILQAFTGQAADEQVTLTFTMGPEDFEGPSWDQIRLWWQFRSDAAADDEDCMYPSLGAAQIDQIQVLFDGIQQGQIEDCEGGAPTQWYWVSLGGVGNFAKVWPQLQDIDQCTDNPSPQVAFVDDGIVVPGTGGTPCVDWCYGPNGYVLNTTGGLLGPQYALNNHVQTPVIDWPTGPFPFTGAYLEFNLWSHPLQGAADARIAYTWKVRSTSSGDPGALQDAPWRTGAFFSGLANYNRYRVDLSNAVVADCTYFQVALGVRQEDPLLAPAGGYETTPAPYYDDVCVKVFDRLGPALSAAEVMLAQDNFPASGGLDVLDLGSNDVRFDRAQNTAPPPLNVPGDELQAWVTPARGAVLNEPPRLWYRVRPNPLFDPYRIAGAPFPDGYVEGLQAYPGGDLWLFDLPDEDFLFPGDVVHYYLRAVQDQAGFVTMTVLPPDTTGFSDFSATTPYGSPFTMKALPALRDDGGGGFTQPEILLWNDYGSLGGEDEWRTTLNNLGFRPGVDYDIYTTKSPDSGAGNGLGGRATPPQIEGYRTILYSSGDAAAFTITDNVVSNDAGDDIGLLNDWFAFQDRNLLLAGNHLACDLAANYGAAGAAFLDWPNVSLVTCDIAPFVGGQSAPPVMPISGNAVITGATCWIAFGACPDPQTFDNVSLMSGAVALASFTAPGCTPGAYPATVAASLAENLRGAAETVIYLPYDLMRVYDPMKAPLQSVERTRLLDDILVFMGYLGGGLPLAVPDLNLSTAVSAALQPVSCYILPNGRGDPLSDVTVLGGGRTDATITVNLLDLNGDPVADYPAEDLYLGTTLEGVAFCEGGAVADANTDGGGATTFSGPLRGGGYSNQAGGELLQVLVAGLPLAQPGLLIGFHSADIDGNLEVILSDAVLWMQDWSLGYSYRSDFYWDNKLDLADAILWVEGGGAACR